MNAAGESPQSSTSGPHSSTLIGIYSRAPPYPVPAQTHLNTSQGKGPSRWATRVVVLDGCGLRAEEEECCLWRHCMHDLHTLQSPLLCSPPFTWAILPLLLQQHSWSHNATPAAMQATHARGIDANELEMTYTHIHRFLTVIMNCHIV